MDNPHVVPWSSARKMVPLKQLSGDDEEDTRLLHKMAQQATRYLESFQWCAVILDGWFAAGIGGIFSIFLFHILPSESDVDEWLWVMNGDLPSIYLAFEDAPSVGEAFREYVDGILRWVNYVRSGHVNRPEDLPPIDTPLTAQWANDLEHRMRSLERILGPLFVESSSDGMESGTEATK